jgi:anthranilate synthase component I
MPTLKVMSRERLADIDTPVSTYLKLCRNRPDSFLLDSVETREISGRYSIVAYDPVFQLELYNDRVVQSEGNGERTSPAQDFFGILRESLQRFRLEPATSWPAVGSLMGFVGYDAIRLIERLPASPQSTFPVARLVFPSRFVVFDHLRRVMVLIAADEAESGCIAKLSEMEAALAKPLVLKLHAGTLSVSAPDREHFCDAVRRAKEYIRAGDIFQVVLSDRFHGETDVDPFEVYRRLRVMSPSPYMFFLDFGGYQLLGASPETLVKVSKGVVTVRPIAGTRGRSDDSRRDRELEQELLESDKESAEHLMLVDLARNDVGRVAGYGSVTVDPFRVVERYSHVMHIVSQVQGRLRPDADAIDAFIAGFPAGTVSGAPKVRAMEIIDELESSGRGLYAGAVGYFGPDGIMDTCIAIRTVLFEGNRFTVRVGAGIVADSVPEMEYKEIQNKAAQSLVALQTAAKGEQ